MADKPIVSVDTDNLDDFDMLLSGKATAAPVEEPEVTPELVDNPEDDPLAEPTTDTDDDADPEPTPEEKDQSKFKFGKKKSAKERIDEITAEKYAAIREAETLRAKLAEIEAARVTPTPQVKPAPAETDGPTLDDLNEDGSLKYPLGELDPFYNRDITLHAVRKDLEERDAQKQAEAAENERLASIAANRNTLATSWVEKVAEAEKTLPDLRQKGQALESTFDNLEPDYAEFLASTIMSMDHGPEVLYYLSDNLEEAHAIADMGPQKATLALGRLEAQFIKGAVPEKKVSSAPNPPPVNRGTTGQYKVRGDTDDLDAFEREFFNK